MNDLPRFAISVRQPWAFALFHGKHLENRVQTAVRHMTARLKPGHNARLCIHAAQGMTRDEYEHGRDLIAKLVGHCPAPHELVRGGIIGTVRFVDVINQSTSPWFFGPKALVFDEAQLLPAPIVCGGDLGFFEWRFAAEHCAAKGFTLQEPKPWMLKWRPAAGGETPAAPKYIYAAPAPLFDQEE